MNISLREYVRDIEHLLIRGKAAYAEQHCKYILGLFPKYVKIYQLLGKSYLLSEKYEEATDIFIRVLSVIPDNYAALTSLGMIAEDQGNLNAAICYMEMANEIFPSNPDIQSEIRQLYNERDGAFPERIMATRAALARTYLKAELFNQAVSVAREAVAEEPARVDLQLLLARAYYQAGMKKEAAELCAQIIDQLPYCLEANKILFIINSSLGRQSESQVFQRRISEIEPYFAFVSKNYPSTDMTPDDAIMLEKLDVPLKEDELYPHEGEEPAAELIKVLYSPLSSTEDDQTSAVENAVISPDAETSQTDGDAVSDSSFLKEHKENLVEREETKANITTKPPSETSQDNDHPCYIDLPNLQNEKGLPGWLKKYSHDSKIDLENKPDDLGNRDVLNFIHEETKNNNDEPTLQEPKESPD